MDPKTFKMQLQSFHVCSMANFYQMVPVQLLKSKENDDFLKIKCEKIRNQSNKQKIKVACRKDLRLCSKNYWYEVEILMINNFKTQK